MRNPLDDFLVEVIEKLLARVAACLGNLRLKLLLKLIELKLNLFGSAALLVDSYDTFLKVHTGLNCANDLIAGTEHAVEQLEFLREQLVDTNIGSIGLVEKVDDYHVILLAVAVASADALLDPLGVPGHIVVHN